LVAVLFVAIVIWAARIVSHTRSLKTRLDALQALAQENPRQISPQVAVALVDGLHGDFAALQADLQPVLWLAPYLGWVPRYGGDIQAAPHLLAIGSDLTDVGSILAKDFAPLLQDPQDDPIPRGLQALQDAGPDLRVAQARLQSASKARAQFEAGSLSPRLQNLVARLDRYLPLAETAIAGSMVVPRLLGVTAPRTYLILAENDDELRATGGYITGVGLMRVEGGRITGISFTDSYAVDDFRKPYPEPPRPLWDYMLSELWLFRDSNWSPDFPTAARKAAYFYEYGKGQRPDGVIALDMQALQLLVRAVQPVQVPGTTEQITGDNVITWLRQSRGGQTPGKGLGKWWKQRKSFMGLLALALKLRLDNGEVDWSTLAQAVDRALVEKHILVYVADPDVAALLSSQGWGGAVTSPAGDYLLVVDSNVGFNKVNALVDETLNYHVTLNTDGSARSMLQIGYHNRSRGTVADCDPRSRYGADYDADMNRCYWDYLRVYVPKGSALTVATPAPLPKQSLYNRKWGGAGRETLTIGPPELGKQVFAVYQLVPRGESRKQRFEYALPQGTVRHEGTDWLYTLTVQKQAGTRSLPLAVTVTLPAGARLLSLDPAPTTQQGTVLSYRLHLDRDRTIRVRYRF